MGVEKQGGKISEPRFMSTLPITTHREPRLRQPCLLVSWSSDAGQLGTTVTNYLKAQTGATEFAEIEPLGFSPIGGVAIDNDVISFPSSKFFACESHNLVIFQSTQPQSKLHAFLNLILDVAQQTGVREIYIVGGLTSRVAHSERRRIRTVVNQSGLKESIAALGMETWMNYQGPPSINSFLLWVSLNRGIPGATFWGEIPFYLSALTDWRASRTMLEVLGLRFSLHLDFTEIEREATNQEARIQRMRQENQGVDNYISRLEKGEGLSQEEAEELVREVADRI